MNNKVAKNALWIIACRIAQALLSLAISTLSARYLGPGNYGLINYAISVVAFVSPIAMLGLSATLVQELLQKPEQEGKTMGTALTMSLISSLLCMAGAAAFVCVANPGETDTLVVCVLYSTVMLSQAVELMQYWFQSKLMSKYTSVTALIAYAIVSAYKIFLLVTGKNVYWFAVSYALDYMIIGIILLGIYGKKGEQKLSFSWQRAKEMVANSKHYILSLLMVTVFSQTDRIMLKLMYGAEETGFYSVAATCAMMTNFVFVALLESFRPVILTGKQTGEEEFKQPMKQLYSIMIYLSLAQSIGFTLLAKPVVDILYGAQYTASIPVLQVLIWYTTFSYIGATRDVWILANNKQNLLWIVNLSGAVINVIVNYLLIPIWGAIGAAVASLLSQFFTNVIMGYLIAPLRPSNKLMLESLNPNILIGMMRSLRKK